MKIKTPNTNLVFIKVDGAKEQTDDGIYIAEEWKELPPTGTVIAVGAGVSACQAGDRVFFERFASIPTPFGDDVRVCREAGIFATVED